MSDWTGINIDEVTKNLANFESETDAIADQYKTAFQIFNDDLYAYWASPRAVAFNTYILQMADIYNQIISVCYDVLYHAGASAVDMAQVNGATFNNPYMDLNVVQGKALKEAIGLREDIDGVQGMNVTAAKDSLTTFTTTAQNVIEGLHNVSTNFGLYDPDGTLQAAYKALIDKKIDSIIEVFNQASGVIASAFEEEAVQVEFGVTQAETELGETEGGDGSTDTRPRMSLGEEIGPRFAQDAIDFAEGVSEKWSRVTGVVSGAGAVVGTVVEAADLVVDEVIDGVLTVPDTLTYLVNGLFDVASTTPGVKTGHDYFDQEIQHDFYENWDSLRNAKGFWDGALGVGVGTLETVADGVQTAVNAVDVAIDWAGNAISDALNWVGNIFW